MAPSRPDRREELLEEARRWIGTAEQPKASNRSPDIDRWLKAVGSPLGSPWCSAFTTACGVAVYGAKGWPLRKSGRVQDVVDDAVARGMFTLDLSKASPGDLIVFYYPKLERYGHIAVVEKMMKRTAASIDGNTAPAAAPGAAADREGYVVAAKKRPRSSRMGVILLS